MEDRKLVAITGAGSGIGEAAAKRLAEQGYMVAVLDINAQNAARVAADICANGGDAIHISCDVGNGVSVEQAIQHIEASYNLPILNLINNAGVGGPFHRVDQVTDEEWEWIINTNLKSVFLFTRNLLPKMKENGYGRIVNIASIQGILGSAHSSTYVASKHGMIGYTKTIAAEWGEYGITCNAICPGYVDTKLGARDDTISDYMLKVLSKSPIKRVAQPIEIAAMIQHLLGPYGGYINGASITMDGGISAHVGITSEVETEAT